jgi:MinD superfamily P-loop ATPase
MTSRVIAIAGAKGSPGCSFLAVALARCLSHANISTLLLDADAEGGGLAAMLEPASARSLRELGSTAFDDEAVQIEQRLWFAELSQEDCGSLSGFDLASATRAKHQAVVVDLGHSAGSLQKQLSAASDWLLWVVAPDRSGLERADRALESGALGAGNVGLVINRVRPGCLARADEVLSSRHRVPVMARIKENRRVADRLSQGHPVHREWGFGRTLHELARSVYPDVATRTHAWP